MLLWDLARSTGYVALLAFTAATALGALGSTRGATMQPADLDRRYLRQMAHRSAALTGLVMLALHVIVILLDTFVSVSVLGVLIPFTAGWSPFAVGLGTLGLYAIIAAAVSGAMRGRLATSIHMTRRWRAVHLAAYAGWVLSMGHGLLAGTDTGRWWSIALYTGCAAAVAAAVALRIRHRHEPTAASPSVAASIGSPS